MALVARYQVVRTSGVGTFNKDVVIRVRSDLRQTGRRDYATMIPN